MKVLLLTNDVNHMSVTESCTKEFSYWLIQDYREKYRTNRDAPLLKQHPNKNYPRCNKGPLMCTVVLQLVSEASYH
jgi:hypothetical protein